MSPTRRCSGHRRSRPPWDGTGSTPWAGNHYGPTERAADLHMQGLFERESERNAGADGQEGAHARSPCGTFSVRYVPEPLGDDGQDETAQADIGGHEVLGQQQTESYQGRDDRHGQVNPAGAAAFDLDASA